MAIKTSIEALLIYATMLVYLVAAIALLLAVSTALAQGGGYDLSWFTVDGGGGTFSNVSRLVVVICFISSPPFYGHVLP